MKWSVGWGPINACNMRCEFCYSKNVREEKTSVGLNDWKKFVDRNAESIGSINFGTGENSLSKDWFSLVDYIHSVSPEILQGVTTNGHLSAATSKSQDLLSVVERCLSEIDISLDYCNPERHNSFRGQPNAYKWAVDTLERFGDSGIKLTIVMLGTNETLKADNMEGLMELAEKYNSKFRINLYRPTIGINEFSKKFIPSYRTIIEALNYLGKHHTVFSIGDPLFNTILNADKNVKEVDASGDRSLRILHNGDITPSTYLITEQFRKYNILDDIKLDKIDFGQDYCWGRNNMPEDCMKCEYRDACRGGVLDRRFLWYGTINERDPYCPFRENNYVPETQIELSNKPFSSIHYGYLPTMFFGY